MLKKTIYFVFALGFTITNNAQEPTEVMRYEYKMVFKPKIDTDEMKEENVYLDIWEDNSRFATEERVKFIEYVADDYNSVYRRESFETPNGLFPGENWLIQREQQNVFYYCRVGSAFVKTVESLNIITWEITEELSDYEGMQVQKATGDYKGRSWTVWFTKEIPLLEGPYKFKNLPGFVVKAASADGDYLFEFTKSEKTQAVLKYHNFENATVVKESELKKLREVVANKSERQVLEEQGVTLFFNDNSETEQDFNKKQGDSNNYIEKL